MSAETARRNGSARFSLRNSPLFAVAPRDICEHPPEIPIAAERLRPGPINAYVAFAPDWDRPGGVIGPFTAVIRRNAAGTPYIEVPSRADEEEYRFWYSRGIGELWRPRRSCWYQSGATLRFIRRDCSPGIAE
jgi:hypothetical protein